MAADIAAVAEAAPFFAPLTPWGKPMSVRMTSAGRYGWFTDAKGYRYIDRHPSGSAWPPIPESVLAVWRDPGLARARARLLPRQLLRREPRGWVCTATPTRPTSPGRCSRSASAIPAVFRMGGPARKDPTASILLESGDVVVFGGPARLAYHGIDRIRFGASRLLPEGGRINLTCRVVD